MATRAGSLQIPIQMKINSFHFLTEGFWRLTFNMETLSLKSHPQKHTSENAHKVHTRRILPQRKDLIFCACSNHTMQMLFTFNFCPALQKMVISLKCW